MRFRAASFLVALCLLFAAQALAVNFTFECRSDNFATEPAGQDHVFRSPIAGVPPGSDAVQITFETNIPDAWFAQWCQKSTGTCYLGDATINLSSGVQDSLRIYFFTQGDLTPQYGWVNITIRSVADPLEVAHCTYTLFSGLPLPPHPINEVDCTDNVRQLTSGTYAEFYTPIENHTPTNDSLIVTMDTEAPGDWFAQFCQQSTGTCFYDRGTIPLPPGERDSIHVQVFLGAGPSQGAFNFVVQSKRNPSLAHYCFYRVYLGLGSTGVADGAFASGPRVWVVPNPSSSDAAIFLRPAAAGAGEFSIYSADGRLVRTFPGLDLPSDARPLRWDGRDLRSRVVPSGAYFYRFHSGGQEARGLIIRSR